MEITGWALVPVILASALLVVGYWWMFRQGRRLLSRALTRMEQRNSVSITYSTRTVRIVGKVSAWRRIRLELAVLALHFAAYFAPLVIIGCVVMACGGWLESLVVWMMKK